MVKYSSVYKTEDNVGPLIETAAAVFCFVFFPPVILPCLWFYECDKWLQNSSWEKCKYFDYRSITDVSCTLK